VSPVSFHLGHHLLSIDMTYLEAARWKLSVVILKIDFW
jgi:hypothetical protein